MSKSQVQLWGKDTYDFPPAPPAVCVPDPYYSCGPDGDPYWDNVVLMLHYRGNYVDEKGHDIFVTGTTAGFSTAPDPVKFGDNSWFAGGTTPGGGGAARIYTEFSEDFDLNGGDFTIENWVYIRTSQTRPRSFGTIRDDADGPSGNGLQEYFIGIGTSGVVTGASYPTGASTTAATGTQALTLAGWVHIAFCRVGDVYTWYNNGVPVASATSSYRRPAGQKRVFLGQGTFTLTNDGFDGYLAETRITKGVARYTGPFNIPAEAFPDFEGDVGYFDLPRTVLILHADSITSPLIFSPDFTTNGQDTVVPVSPYTVNDPTAVTFAADGATFVCDGTSNAISYSGNKLKLIGGTEQVRRQLRHQFTVEWTGTPTGTGDAIRFAYFATSNLGFDWRVVSGVLELSARGGPTTATRVAIATLSVDVEYLLEIELFDDSANWKVDGVVLYTSTVPTSTAGNLTLGPATGSPGGITFFRISNFTTTENRIADSSCYQPKTVQLLQSGTVSADEVKFGAGSVLVPNTGVSTLNGITVADHQDFDFGSGDFTIECWAYRNANTYIGYLYYATMGGEFSFRVLTTGLITIVYRVNATTAQTRTTAVSFPLEQWNFVVVQRRGLNFEFYLNGVLADTVAVSGGAASTVNSTGFWYWGRTNASSAQSWNGYIEEIRVTKGAARYEIAPEDVVPWEGDTDPFWADVKVFSYFDSLTEQSSNARTLSLSGSAAFATDRFLQGGQSIRITPDTQNSGIEILDTATDSRFSSGDYDIEVLFYLVTLTTVSGNTLHILNNRTTANNNGWGLELQSNGRVSMSFGPLQGAQETSGRCRAGQWNLVRLRRTSSQVQLYVNFQLASTSATGLGDAGSAGNFVLGRRADANTRADCYFGALRVTTALRSVAYLAFDPNDLPNCDSSEPGVVSPEAGAAALTGQRLLLSQGELAASVITGGSGELLGRRINLGQGFFGVAGLSAQVLQGRRMTLRQGFLTARQYVQITDRQQNLFRAFQGIGREMFYEITVSPDGTFQITTSGKFPGDPDIVFSGNWIDGSTVYPGNGNFYDIVFVPGAPSPAEIPWLAGPGTRAYSSNLPLNTRVRLSSPKTLRYTFTGVIEPEFGIFFADATIGFLFNILPADNNPDFAIETPRARLSLGFTMIYTDSV